jgi:type III pantothenate kinase
MTKKIFVIDIGNSTIAIGIFENKSLYQSMRFATNKDFLSTEYQLMIQASFKQKKIMENDFEGAILSSTVPSLISTFTQVVENIFNFKPLIVGPGIKTGLKIKYDNPKEIGPDRILHAVAGLDVFSAPLIIVDLGTGLVFDIINNKGEYAGGAIAPGLSVAANALFDRGSMLNTIQIEKPENVIGTNTQAALRSGIYYGYLELIKGLVAIMKKELEEDVKVIGTGGDINIFIDDQIIFDHVDIDLNLKGLVLLYFMNK